MTGADATGAGVTGGGGPHPGPAAEADFAVALATLPGLGPGRLRALLAAWPPAEAWEQVVAGTAHRHPLVAAACRPDPAIVGQAWGRAAAAVDPVAVARAHAAAGVGVAVRGGPGYPPALAGDPEAPAVVFWRGDPAALDVPAVAIVGTRRCTRYGREVARALGRDLAAAGVAVVSGLALGVDGSAHAGALEAGGAPAVGVVGSGLDVPYPPSHRGLWADVARSGVLVGEAPLGTPPEAWRFPVRNRVIAALAAAVVVVESPLRGGSLHTVEAAAVRGVPVLAVPGPVTSPASALPNSLLVDGCAPARDALDVLVALDLARPGAPGRPPPAPADPPELRPPLDARGRAALDALGCEGATFDELCLRSGLAPADASVVLARLETAGWVAVESGRWCPVGRP